jgi:hypothetical protein
MKTKFTFKITFPLLLSLLVASCIDNGFDLTGQGDAFILVEINGQDTVMGLGLHAFSYSDFKSVTVTVTGNPSLSYTLTPYLNYKQDYFRNTPLSEYSKTKPATGEYVFNALFADGKTLVLNDVLTSDIIPPPKIKTCSYRKQNSRVEVEWEKVQLADVYNVKLLDHDGNILFVSLIYNNGTTGYYFGADTQGWQSSTSVPATGQIVVVQVTAYLMEPNQGPNDLQCIASSRAVITWDK